MSDLTPEQSYGAEQIQDALETKEVKLPKVNVEDDYENSKKFSNSSEEADSNNFDSINRTGFSNNQSETIEQGNPKKFEDMAQEITSHFSENDEQKFVDNDD